MKITETTTVEEVAIDTIDLQNRNFDNNSKEVIGKVFIIYLEKILCPNYIAELYPKEDLTNRELCNTISVELPCVKDRKVKFTVATYENPQIYLVCGMDLWKKVSRKKLPIKFSLSIHWLNHDIP